jgi:hypothetical protein
VASLFVWAVEKAPPKPNADGAKSGHRSPPLGLVDCDDTNAAPSNWFLYSAA